MRTCAFRKLPQRVNETVGKAKEIYLIVALTRLSENEGLFAVEGLGTDDAPDATAPDAVPHLEVGDAIAWTVRNPGRSDQGEGGLMMIVTFKSA